MGKRKSTRSEASKTLLNSKSVTEDEIQEALQSQHQPYNQIEEEASEGNGFFACYLLTSLSPRYKGHTYIGFTVNPKRRIRQHNGEIGCGAWRTKKRRPWEMVLCIYGFPTNVSALQFEWAWQHPVESLAVRKAAAGFKSLSGIANKIKLAYTMLTLPSWQNMNITVNFFSTKYTKHSACCPTLPEHMKIEIGSMDELPCYTKRLDDLLENEVDAIDEMEFDNSTSNSDSIPDVAFDDSTTHESPTNPKHGDKIGESFGSITSPPMVKSAPEPSLMGTEIIEDTDLMFVMNRNSGELSEPNCGQSGSARIPLEAEIIDLSTPSPSCRVVLDRKKRRVSSSVNDDFIDLTKSPNFVQL